MSRAILAAGAAVLLAGCGVTFSNVPLNASLPDNFKKRTLYTHTEILRLELPELAGTILYRRGDTGEFDRGDRIVKAGHDVLLQPVKDQDMLVYASKVDRGAAVQGSYLAFAAAFSEKQTANVDVRDTALVFIRWNDVPLEELRAEAERPNPRPNTRRYWVQGALLSAITIDNYVEISTSASAVVGDTFGAKGNAYNKQGATTHDYWIALELLDLETLGKGTKGLDHLPPADSTEREAFIKRLRAEAMRIEKLNWKAN